MSKTRIVILIGLLLVILGFVLLLSMDPESQLGRFIYSNAVTPALLFFVFFAAFAGVLKISFDLMLPDRMPRNAGRSWEQTRVKGKLSYVLNALLIFGIPIMLSLAIQLAATEQTPYEVRNFVVLAIVLVGSIAAVAAAMWNYQESLYQRSKEIEKLTKVETRSQKDSNG